MTPSIIRRHVGPVPAFLQLSSDTAAQPRRPVPTFLHVKEQLQGAQVPDMDPVDSTAHRLPTEVRVLPACCVIAAEEQARAPGSRPIPLMMGTEMGPLVEHEKGREEQ